MVQNSIYGFITTGICQGAERMPRLPGWQCPEDASGKIHHHCHLWTDPKHPKPSLTSRVAQALLIRTSLHWCCKENKTKAHPTAKEDKKHHKVLQLPCKFQKSKEWSNSPRDAGSSESNRAKACWIYINRAARTGFRSPPNPLQPRGYRMQCLFSSQQQHWQKSQDVFVLLFGLYLWIHSSLQWPSSFCQTAFLIMLSHFFQVFPRVEWVNFDEHRWTMF